ncbi:hypothetical protein [Romboutsia sp.]|uniref:hypothetical protein n=1 Tax=Romboutsia sp. TaxID=1965302 RepID=UPI003F3BDC6D
MKLYGMPIYKCRECRDTGKIEIPLDHELDMFEYWREHYSQTGNGNYDEARRWALEKVDTKKIDCPECNLK